MIRIFAEAFVYILKGVVEAIKSLMDGFSLSGATILIFSTFILVGLYMTAHGNRAGDEVWKTFSTALTTFVSAKKIAQYEAEQAAMSAKIKTELKDGK